MKQIIISLILFSIIYCTTLKDCLSVIPDKDNNCPDTPIEDLNEFSCYQTTIIDYTIQNSENICFAYPDDEDSKRIFLDFYNGFKKEKISSKGEKSVDDDLQLLYPDKNEETDTDNTFPERFKVVKLTEKDDEIIKSKNTCSYLLYGRVLDMKNEQSLNSYPDIKKKYTCFNANIFPELEDKINCGYAEIKYTIGEKDYNFKTCFYVPGNNMTDNMENYFIKNEVDNIMKNEIKELLEGFAGTRNLNSKSKRQLHAEEDGEDTKEEEEKEEEEEKDKFEITVEDKRGKIIKIASNSDKIDLIFNKRKFYNHLLIVSLAIGGLIILLIIAARYCLIK